MRIPPTSRRDIGDVATTAEISSPIAARGRERFTSTAARPPNTGGVSASPERDVDALTAATDKAEVDEVKHRETAIEAETVMINPVASEHCIYCELTNAPRSSKRHWHDICSQPQSAPDKRSYDTMLYTMFFLYKSGWLQDWIRKEEYQVAVVYAHLEKVLNEPSDN
jgi:hypothetical protein